VFNKDSLAYRDTVPFITTQYTVTPTLGSSSMSMMINDSLAQSGATSKQIPLAVGINAIKVIVVAQDTAYHKSYIIQVFRHGPDTNAYLTKLNSATVSMRPVFNKDSLAYRDTVPFITTQYTVTPTLGSSSMSMMINDSLAQSGATSKQIPLAVGINAIKVKVVAQDTAFAKNYMVNVVRLAADTVAKLNSLGVSGALKPAFNRDTLNYYDTVMYAVAQYTVTPSSASLLMGIKVNESPVPSGSVSQAIALSVGANVITAKVTAQDTGKYRVYTIRVVRRPPSSNIYLDSLAVSAGALTPAQDTSVTAYSAYVPNEIASITVKPYLHDTTGRVKINNVPVVNKTVSGAIPLEVGSNSIVVKVTAQDGATERTTTLTIERGTPPNEISGLYLTTGSQTLTKAESPYHVTGAIAIGPSGTLIIEPGVTLLMDPGMAIDVQGTLIARGTASDSIYFRAYNGATGKWGYISYATTAVSTTIDGSGNYTAGCILEYCVVENGGNTSTKQGTIYTKDCLVLVKSCRVASNSNCGIYCTTAGRVENSRVVNNDGPTSYGGIYIGNGGIVTSCNISGNGGGGLYIQQHGMVSACTLSNNDGIGIYGTSSNIVSSVIVANTGRGLQISSSSVTDCAVTGNKSGGIDLTYYSRVEHCVISGNSYSSYGAGCFASSNDTIMNCTISNNTTTGSDGGVYLGSYSVMTGNTVTDNSATDIAALYAGPASTITNNTFANNRVIGQSAGKTQIELSTNSFTNNNIANNTGAQYLLKNDNTQGTPDVDATHNYWGTTLTTESLVRGQIYDFFKDNKVSIVSLAPLLTAPAAGAPTIP
jgi:translation elongation factor EF-1beta